MMKYIVLLALTFSVTNLFAIEVGDTIPACSNSIQMRLPSGDDVKGCVEDFSDKDFLMIEFMSIYCGSCVRALPVVNKIGIGAQERVETHFVTLDRKLDEVLNFWQEYSTEISHPMLFDIERTSLKPYKIKYTPTTIVIDKTGTVIYKHVGEFDDEEANQLRAIFE